jgi:hypothetical protein
MSGGNHDTSLIKLHAATWAHGKSRYGAATYINAPDGTGESVTVAIISASLCEELRVEIAQAFCDALNKL